MQWLHNLFDAAKYCILDAAVLTLFCIGIAQIIRHEIRRLRGANKKSQGRGQAAAPPAKPAAPRPVKAAAAGNNPAKKKAAPRPQQETIQ